MTSTTDCIEREILLNAPLDRVWRALSDPAEFGNWFGFAFEGTRFVAGEHIKGRITHPGYDHLVDLLIDRIEPKRLLALRWHPYAIEPAVDYSKEEPTLVEFTLRETSGGVLLRLVESGFDKIPQARRDEAFRMNSGGWDQQMRNIAAHVAKT